MRVLRGHKEAVQHLAYAPDGRTLLSVSTYREARLWGLAGGGPRWALDSTRIFWAGFTPDGQRLLTDDLKKKPPQPNLWVNSGSGKAPSR